MRLRADRLVERRSEAQQRNELWAALPPREKLKLLQQRPGLCQRQSIRLSKQIDGEGASK